MCAPPDHRDREAVSRAGRQALVRPVACPPLNGRACESQKGRPVVGLVCSDGACFTFATPAGPTARRLVGVLAAWPKTLGGQSWK